MTHKGWRVVKPQYNQSILGASNEYPQFMYSWRNKKKYDLDTPSGAMN